MIKGYLALVLHAHLPYVRHPEKGNYLEEKWFFEALTETYIPLINVFDALVNDGVDFRITLSLSPPLISMMSDDLLKQRYLIYLDKLQELADRELVRTKGTDFEKVARMYGKKFSEIREIFVSRYQMDLLQAFKKFRDLGKIELITCCATHGYLPLMIKPESIKAQVAVAVDTFKKHLGFAPRGMWLPECAYAIGVDQILKSYGIQYFFVDTHGIMFATPCPVNGVFAPLYTPAGMAAFGRDVETSRQVWDMNHGYPGDFYYREFYRDIGFDLDTDYIGPYVGDDNLRIDTGVKYYRITGKTDQKEVYDPVKAADRAAEHAGHFLYNREKQVEHLSAKMDRPPMIVSPYDAELFGHWWYEGPQWLEFLCRKLHFDQDTVQTITPWEYLLKFPTNQVATLPMTSWGHNGYSEVWLNSSNDWIYRHIHRAEERMAELANHVQKPGRLQERALRQMARELLLAQSSDWAFIMKMGTSVGYAQKRTKDHISRFNHLYWALRNDELEEEEISNLEELDNIFPELDYRVYRTGIDNIVPLNKKAGDTLKKNHNILMLSWEFPPKTVGGLARHVYDLSRALVAQGEEVHLITCHVSGAKYYEVVEGVHVYRVSVENTEHNDFLSWVEKLNLGMIEAAQNLMHDQKFTLIHAHDWLVAKAAITLKHAYQLPLVSTIHATEFGRNQGIHNEIQRHINQNEWTLTYESWKIIGCSMYMAKEIAQVFQLPADKIRIIANGVEVKNIKPSVIDPGFHNRYATPVEKIVYFIGRLVPEKGVQVLIEAVPRILAQCPEAKFVISGKGPYEAYLLHLAESLGIKEKVLFTGFADDDTRNMLFAISSAAVFPSLYEPFGIVALEAMAARTPVVVSETGGLTEVVQHEVDGLKVYAGDVESLAQNITRILTDEGLAQRVSQAAWEKVNTVFNWGAIAAETTRVYQEVSAEARRVGFASGE